MKSTRNKIDEMMLPRGYLSWSALDTFRRDREKFMRHYFYGEPKLLETPEIQFGKKFAEALQKKKRAHHDPVIDMVLRALPKMSRPEHQIRAVMPSDWGNIPLLGRLDQYDPKTHDFDEFKTGVRKWTQNMAQNHGQLKFYALMLWLRHKIIENKKTLVWIETEWTDDGIRPTGRIERFSITINLAELLVFGKDVINSAKEISELYQQAINENF